MSTPDAPGSTPAEAVEPGHRARALAASLLGELTGQRRSSLSFSPQEPTGLASVPRTDSPAPDSPAATSPADPASPVPRAADAPLAASPAQPDAPSTASTSTASTSSAAIADGAPTTSDRSPASGSPLSGAPATSQGPSGPATPPGAGPVPARSADASTLGSSPDASPAPSARPRPADEVGSAAPLRERSPEQAERPGQAPGATAAVAPRQDGTSQVQQVQATQGQEVRPAPFAYLAVAQHHTGPARATANGALDQAGQRISSRVDRAMVRRAALVTTEAASLLDACDALDERARAVDATWSGERHAVTEVREFEGAWSAFYDAQGALAQHVSG